MTTLPCGNFVLILWLALLREMSSRDFYLHNLIQAIIVVAETGALMPEVRC